MEAMGSTLALEQSSIHKHLTTCHFCTEWFFKFISVDRERGTLSIYLFECKGYLDSWKKESRSMLLYIERAPLSSGRLRHTWLGQTTKFLIKSHKEMSKKYISDKLLDMWPRVWDNLDFKNCAKFGQMVDALSGNNGCITFMSPFPLSQNQNLLFTYWTIIMSPF